MTSISENNWKCKCGCVSKQTHKFKWVLISKYNAHNSSNIQFETDSNSLFNKLTLKGNNSEKRKISEIKCNYLSPTKKVKYDENTKKIIIDDDDINNTNDTNDSNNINNINDAFDLNNHSSNSSEFLSKIIFENNLIELRDLFQL